MQLSCKQCGADIRAEDINIERLIAKCAECHAVFGFAEDIPGAATESTAPRRRPRRAKVPLPSGFRLEDHGVGLRIVYRWWRPLFIFIAVFTVFWCGFLVFWYGMALATDAPILALVFPLIHVAVGLGLAYYTIAGFLNRTYIDVDGRQIAITHAPLPWPGSKTIPAHSIAQLYVIENRRRSRNGEHFSYDLRAIDKSGQRLKVLSTLPEPDQALYVEQAVEERLGIESRPVPGEYRS